MVVSIVTDDMAEYMTFKANLTFLCRWSAVKPSRSDIVQRAQDEQFVFSVCTHVFACCTTLVLTCSDVRTGTDERLVFLGSRKGV